MFTNNGLTRRGILKAGGIGGAALAAGSGSAIFGSFSAKGASAPVNVVASNSILANTMFHILGTQKYLDQFGVTMNDAHVTDTSLINPALIGGQSDICVLGGFGLALATIARGAEMKVLGSNCLLVQDAVYSSKPDIKTVKDLEGKSVGTGAIGAFSYQVMVALMQKKGVDVSKVTFHNVGTEGDIFKAVSAGTVDAGPATIDFYNQQAKYGVHSLTDGNLWTELPDYTSQGTYASMKAIATKRDGLVRVLAAFSKLFTYIQSPDSKDMFVSARAAVTGKNDTAEAVDFWNFLQKYKPYAADFRLSEDRLNYMQKINMQFSLQKKIVPYAQVTDMSIARDAVKLAGA